MLKMASSRGWGAGGKSKEQEGLLLRLPYHVQEVVQAVLSLMLCVKICNGISCA